MRWEVTVYAADGRLWGAWEVDYNRLWTTWCLAQKVAPET